MANLTIQKPVAFSKKNPHHVAWCEAMRVGWLEAFDGVATMPYEHDHRHNFHRQRAYECGRFAAAFAKAAGVRPKWGYGVIMPDAVKEYAYEAMREIHRI